MTTIWLCKQIISDKLPNIRLKYLEQFTRVRVNELLFVCLFKVCSLQYMRLQIMHI